MGVCRLVCRLKPLLCKECVDYVDFIQFFKKVEKEKLSVES